MTGGGKFTNKMENKKISYENFCSAAFRRAEQMTVKSEAVWAIFQDLGGLINISKLARQYFKKSQSWFAQKLYGNVVDGKERAFTAEEYKQITAALRDIAQRLNDYADALDNAE